MTWRARARSELVQMAFAHRPFSADDLIERVGQPDPGHEPNAKNNAIGTLFREARAEGLIEPVGVVPSRQKHRKGGMIRLWVGIR